MVGIVTAGAALVAIGAAANLGTAFGMMAGTIGSGLTLGQAIAVGAGFGFGSGFAGSLLNGGSLADAFKAGIIGGLIGGITAGITHGIGTYAKDHNWGWGRTSMAHGLAHGGISEATGGDFRHGFYSGFFSAAAAGPISNTIGGGPTGQNIAAAIVGGTASAIGGGKFANGAVSGAFTYLFNQLNHNQTSKETRLAVTVESRQFVVSLKSSEAIELLGEAAWQALTRGEGVVFDVIKMKELIEQMRNMPELKDRIVVTKLTHVQANIPIDWKHSKTIVEYGDAKAKLGRIYGFKVYQWTIGRIQPVLNISWKEFTRTVWMSDTDFDAGTPAKEVWKRNKSILEGDD